MSDGRHVRAYAALRRLFDPADPAHYGRQKFRGVMYFADAAVHADQVRDARVLLGELEELAGTTTSPTLHHQLAYARAVLADDQHAEDLFRAALAADLVRWPLTTARLQLAFGSWLRRQRRAAESRDPLRSAFRTFAAIGATGWAETARGELRAAGEVTGRDTRRAAHDLLSPQELRVARLVAEGLSNKQIGERLYLSPRTVSSHLYRIFPKLDITSRGQMAGRLRGDSAPSDASTVELPRARSRSIRRASGANRRALRAPRGLESRSHTGSTVLEAPCLLGRICVRGGT
jgi:DNA-binding CsgD family transcriptional regulator